MNGPSQHTASLAASEPSGNDSVGLGLPAAAVPMPVPAMVQPVSVLAPYLAPALGRCELHAEQHRILAADTEFLGAELDGNSWLALLAALTMV